MKLEVTRKSHSRIEVVKGQKRRRKSYGVGDTFDGTEKELKAFKDRLQRAEVRTLVDDEDPEQPKQLTPKQKLIAEAKELGLEIDESATAKDIQAAIDADKESKQGDGSEDQKTPGDPEGTETQED